MIILGGLTLFLLGCLVGFMIYDTRVAKYIDDEK